jgi:hypothetical protein
LDKAIPRGQARAVDPIYIEHLPRETKKICEQSHISIADNLAGIRKNVPEYESLASMIKE